MLTVKILVPEIVATSLERGHDGIRSISSKLRATIAMTSSGHYYPNTTERVCLVYGDEAIVVYVFALIHRKIVDKSRALKSKRDFESRIFMGRAAKMIILIDNDVAGQVIGIYGSSLKNISHRTGCTVVVTTRVEGRKERAIIFYGNARQIVEGFEKVLSGLKMDNACGVNFDMNYASEKVELLSYALQNNQMLTVDFKIKHMTKNIQCNPESYHILTFQNKMRSLGLPEITVSECSHAMLILEKYGGCINVRKTAYHWWGLKLLGATVRRMTRVVSGLLPNPKKLKIKKIMVHLAALYTIMMILPGFILEQKSFEELPQKYNEEI